MHYREHPKIVSQTRCCPVLVYGEQVVEHPLCPQATKLLLANTLFMSCPLLIHNSVISCPLGHSPAPLHKKRNLGPPKLATNENKTKRRDVRNLGGAK